MMQATSAPKAKRLREGPSVSSKTVLAVVGFALFILLTSNPFARLLPAAPNGVSTSTSGGPASPGRRSATSSSSAATPCWK